jgi:Mce-associated membrane protein
MKGDADASRHRLNPPSTLTIPRLRDRRPKSGPESEIDTETKSEDSAAAEARADPGDNEAKTRVVAEDSARRESGASAPVEATLEPIHEAQADVSAPDVERGQSRVGPRWLIGVSVALILLASALGVGGYFALRANQESQVVARNDIAALWAAKDCVAATQAPDAGAMNASEQKIIDCGTGQFRTQALVYAGMLVQAYRAANVQVQVADMRAAVERNNSDGTIDILVTLRVNVANDQTQARQTGYRLRATMAFAEGQYRISKLDQVTK